MISTPPVAEVMEVGSGGAPPAAPARVSALAEQNRRKGWQQNVWGQLAAYRERKENQACKCFRGTDGL